MKASHSADMTRRLARAVLVLTLATMAPGTHAEGEPVTPLPPIPRLDPGKVQLGKRLFHDTRLSRGNTVSCADCHRLELGGDDDRQRSPSPTDGTPLSFNTPTVLNVTFNFRFNWRGNFRTLKEQNEAVLLDQHVMNMTWEELLSRLRSDEEYRRAFAAVYKPEMEPPDILDALAIFQQSLVTPDAPFDRYLRGDEAAVSEEIKRGYTLFKTYGCIACHQGVNVGGNLFQRLGIFQDPVPSDQAVSVSDLGRFALTGKERDRHVFRVPGLRNVDLTAPYFHDGSMPTLERAVAAMGRMQLGRMLSDQDIGLIVQFLRSLTGVYREPPGDAVAVTAP